MLIGIGDEEIRTAIENTMLIKTGSGNTNIIIGFRPEEYVIENELLKNSVLWCGNGGGSGNVDHEKHNEIRLKGEGGYIVAPPSIHPNGNRYEIINNANSPVTFSKIQISKLISALKKQYQINEANIPASTNSNKLNLVDSFESSDDDTLVRQKQQEKEEQQQQYQLIDEERVFKIVASLKPHYQQGLRNDFVLYLSGWMKKRGVAIVSAYKVIEGLTENDEEKHARFRTVEETYKKQDLNGISGYSGLLSILTGQLQSKGKASQLLNELNLLFPVPSQEQTSTTNKIIASAAGGGGKAAGKVSQILIKLAKTNTKKLFKDQYGKGYAKIHLKDHNEIISLDNSKFKYFLSKLYYDHTGRGDIAGQESINDAIRVLYSEIFFEDNTLTLNLRVAWNKEKDTIYYDMTDEKWRCIEITKGKWEIVTDSGSSIKSSNNNNDSILLSSFIRYNQTPQVEPDRTYDSGVFEKFLDLTNIKDPKARLLTKVWIISLLIPDISHAINITHGEKGSAKTSLCMKVKQLIDPDALELLTIPKKKEEFVQQLNHNYLVVYDNIKKVRGWFSDEVCRAVTGIGNSKRRLYTDDEDVIYRYKLCIMLNGINISLTEPDALDRSILTEVAKISNEERKEWTEVMAEFDQLKPKLFAFILDRLSKALQIKPNLQLKNLPRMADFAIWGEAIARVMGYGEMEFVNAYYENIGRQNIKAIEANPLSQAIVKFCEEQQIENREQSAWEGSNPELLEQLQIVAGRNGIDTSQKKWPKATNSLTKRLNPIRSNLLEGLGICITDRKSVV